MLFLRRILDFLFLGKKENKRNPSEDSDIDGLPSEYKGQNAIRSERPSFATENTTICEQAQHDSPDLEVERASGNSALRQANPSTKTGPPPYRKNPNGKAALIDKTNEFLRDNNIRASTTSTRCTNISEKTRVTVQKDGVKEKFYRNKNKQAIRLDIVQ